MSMSWSKYLRTVGGLFTDSSADELANAVIKISGGPKKFMNSLDYNIKDSYLQDKQNLIEQSIKMRSGLESDKLKKLFATFSKPQRKSFRLRIAKYRNENSELNSISDNISNTIKNLKKSINGN